tara:strand:- start:91 stop:441 length:351 start_codon:yes stop_codon:yes gene_type:complete
MDDHVTLWVGGIGFLTTRATMGNKDGYFSALLKHQTDVSDFWIDRDPVHFRYILNHMRGSVILPSDDQSLRELLVEADYYCLGDLVSIITRALHKHPGTFEMQFKRLIDMIGSLRN